MRLSRWFPRKHDGAVYREPHFHYDPAFETLAPPVRLEGYFPSPRYFAGHEAIVRRDLAPPAAEDAESRRLAPLIGGDDTIALHVRRGDYVSRPKINALMGTCSVAYYEAALAKIPGNGTVFVFSDDVAWAKGTFAADRTHGLRRRRIAAPGARRPLADDAGAPSYHRQFLVQLVGRVACPAAGWRDDRARHGGSPIRRTT